MDTDTILTTAIEVSIAIAGFSGIVVALGPRGTPRWPETSRIQLSALLLGTIAVVAFAFLPLVLSAAGVGSLRIWTISSGAHALYLLGVIGHRAWQIKRVSVSDVPPAMIAAGAFAVVAFGLQLANLVALQTAWPFLTAIIVMLLSCFAVFASLLYAVWAAD